MSPGVIHRPLHAAVRCVQRVIKIKTKNVHIQYKLCSHEISFLIRCDFLFFFPFELKKKSFFFWPTFGPLVAQFWHLAITRCGPEVINTAGTGGPRQPLSHRHTSGLYFAYLNQQMFCYFSLKKYKNVLISCCFSQNSACKFNKKPVSGSRVQLDEISGSRSAGEAKTRAKAFLDVEHRSCFLSCKREEPLSGRGFHITSLSVIVALWLRVIFKTEADCISQKALLGVFIEFLMAVLWICKKLWFHDPGGFWVLQYLETFSNRQHSDSFLLHFPSFSFTFFFSWSWVWLFAFSK